MVFMAAVGMKMVLVHGGGHRISEALAKKGIKSHFVDGLRYTDAETIAVVRDEVMAVNQELVSLIGEVGWKARTVTPEDRVLKAVKITSSEVDLGLVGEIKETDTAFFDGVCKQGCIPVVSPLAYGFDGLLYNINADMVASKMATDLQAEKLIFLTDQPGIMRDKANRDSLISVLRPSQVKSLTEEGIITSGMIPKVQAGLAAMESGVAKVHLVGGHISHALLLEIFTNQGVGTEIVPEGYED